jgi:hypothetical protein
MKDVMEVRVELVEGPEVVGKGRKRAKVEVWRRESDNKEGSQ